jgi:hypothetical protein
MVEQVSQRERGSVPKAVPGPSSRVWFPAGLIPAVVIAAMDNLPSVHKSRHLRVIIHGDCAACLTTKLPDTDLTQMFLPHSRKASNNGERGLAPGTLIYKANRS